MHGSSADDSPAGVVMATNVRNPSGHHLRCPVCFWRSQSRTPDMAPDVLIDEYLEHFLEHFDALYRLRPVVSVRCVGVRAVR